YPACDVEEGRVGRSRSEWARGSRIRCFSQGPQIALRNSLSAERESSFLPCSTSQSPAVTLEPDLQRLHATGAGISYLAYGLMLPLVLAQSPRMSSSTS